ncbi:MAG: sulfite oxidase-like oxidoreductase [bacterium]|nr:sulfite oxidase-like oxidoreductase [bacterium]
MTEYNKSYIKAKTQQASQHKITGKTDEGHRDRLPPGQIETDKFPILDLGIRPKLDEYADWKVDVKGLVENKETLSIDDLKNMGGDARTLDFHCVTRWSRYDLPWAGVEFNKIAERAKVAKNATHVIFHSYDDYTTNVPLDELTDERVLLVYELEGKDIPPEHGGPVRMIIPSLYGWKSAKFVIGIEFLDHDQPGFWEIRGYNNHADPWIEERYS